MFTWLPPIGATCIPDDLWQVPWVARLESCPQDPVHHGEGNVLIHTKMVLEALLKLPEFQQLGREDQAVVWAACLLHDVAKPWTTKVEADGRITAKGHSAAGAKAARRILYDLNVHPPAREQVCALVRLHQLPFFCTEGSAREAERKAILASLSARSGLLAIVNDADGVGRICPDSERLKTNVGLFRLLAEELDILDAPYRFASAEARFVFCHNQEVDQYIAPPERYRCEVVVMCGVPGSGKSTWVRKNLPGHKVVSLDQIRGELKIDPSDSQSAVAAEGRERLKTHLRASQDVVWDATNVTRDHRSRIIGVARDYGARIRIVQVEAPLQRLLQQNKSRTERVPEQVVDKLLDKWEFPTLDEAHTVEHVF